MKFIKPQLLEKKLHLRFCFFLFVLSVTCTLTLYAQSLWEDHNPYSGSANIKDGSILKLIIDEPVVLSYDYQNQASESVDINLVPDRTLTGFLPPASSKHNINKNYGNKLSSRTQVRLQLAVIVNGDPNTKNQSIKFSGIKLLSHENNVSKQQIAVSGQVHLDDISAGRVIFSNQVANLQMIVVGAPVPRSKNLPLAKEPTTKNTSQETTINQTNTKSTIQAELTDEQKRTLLWEYVNRLLGESSP